ncbi:MAG: molecular chaperone HtpG [Bacteroidaceae bacterium]|nr:molecular chaperone HtpG [Bacteroidaceae bacterium]
MKGNIGVTTENIFPVIKKFLYSDHEIFLREMVSNAVDATQKLKTILGNEALKDDDLAVRISLNKDAGTITISDRGIGMTEQAIDKYINQIAFSGVTDFLEKYKDTANAIIGHFGLGFYSAFMVSDKVEIVTKSYQEGAKAVKWTCDGSPEFELTEADKADRGTDIVLHIAEDCKEFLEKDKIESLLRKYCLFMPVNIVFGKKTEWKEGKMVETEEDNVINGNEPMWTKTPSSLTDEDYKKFYHLLYPMQDDPLFWIHLNVDYPFNLTGILYFPRVNSSIDLQKGKIQLYCNQVFVTDQVDGIVPEFLTLLHGVIDSPDIPLNVSRSYLQSDRDVKKISTYITKKVADRLNQLFKDNRKDFEEKWDDLKLFINYGMLSQEDFYTRAKDFTLLKDVEGKFFTLEEYQTLIKDEQTDKDGNLIYLYTDNKEEQYSYIEAAKAKGYSVLNMDGQLDVPTASMLEQKNEKTRFVRVDSDVADRLIPKEDTKKADLTDEQTKTLTEAMKRLLPAMDKVEFGVEFQPMSDESAPLIITRNEFMRRMKDMSKFQSGMGFYGQMPDAYTVVVNTESTLMKGWMAEAQENADKDNAEPTANEQKLSQAIDLALLQNNLLKGAQLDNFIKRSLEMLK